MSTFENRRWLVIPTSMTGSINFNEVLESSIDTLRTNVDGTKTFIKYQIHEVLETYTITTPNTGGEEPIVSTITAGIYGRPSIYSEEYPEYNHEEILALLATEEWTKPMTELI